jgi:tetratricopeptide (TPR) repeat protein
MSGPLIPFLLAFVLAAMSTDVWLKLGGIGMRFVWPRCVALASWSLRNVCPNGRRWLSYALVLRGYAAADRGDTQRAVTDADLVLETAHGATPDVCWWYLVNAAIDIYVNGGRYGSALSAAERWSAEAQERGRAESPVQHAYAAINRAEALHNVGDHEAALRLLDETERHAKRADRLSQEGLELLRAWILCHVGRAREAWTRLAKIDRKVFGPRYRAEYHLTRAVALCEKGELGFAEREAHAGAGAARRAASRRNALHVEARVAMAAKDDARAIALLERARRHAYQGQAGPVLVHLGEAYERAGKPAEARRAYQDALAADPQSYACAAANIRLAALADAFSR